MLGHRPFHLVTFLACAVFLQDLDPCLAYKSSSGYLLSFVLNISDEKRQEVKELVTQSLHLSDHVPQIHPRGYFCLALVHFFIFLFTGIQVLRFGFVTFLFVITSLFRRIVLCMQ